MILKWTVWLVFAISSVRTCPLICSCDANSTDCRNNNLTELPEYISKEVRFMDLSHNLFMTIPGSISVFRKLERLSLRHNRINGLGLESLQGLQQLQALDLAGNSLTHWDVNVKAIASLPSLLQLDMSHNNLKHFPMMHSGSLKRLDVVECNITGLSEDILKSMPNLTELNLSENKIHTVSTQIASAKLESLNLTKCGIYEVSTHIFVDLPALKILYLAGNNKLQRFDATSPVLQHLDLSDCNLESIPHNSLKNLTYIDLRGNRLRRIEAVAFTHSMPNIRVINLTHNTIDTVDVHAFRNLKKLFLVDLSYNTIDTMHSKTFTSNTHLHKLLLSHNYFHELINFDINSLRYLDMSECEINLIKMDSLMGMPHLQFLNLSHNIFTSIPNNFTANHLQFLDLSLCRIINLRNETFKNIQNLQVLDLAGNRLVEIRSEFLYKIRQVRLGDNSWRCDCHDDHFKQLYVKLTTITSDVYQLTCQTPESLEGKLWHEACDNWYTSDLRKQHAWIYSIVFVVVFMLVFCIMLSLNRSRKHKHRRQLEERERERAETREILQRMRLTETGQTGSSNAPDPREMERPPSYNEAITMPRLADSCGSLNNAKTVNNNNNSKDSRQRPRRKRRKSKSSTSTENVQQQSMEREHVNSSDHEAPALTACLESDV